MFAKWGGGVQHALGVYFVLSANELYDGLFDLVK